MSTSLSPPVAITRWRLDYVIPDVDPALSTSAEKLERLVFRDSLGYGREVWEREYSGWEHRTVWILLSHGPDRIPVGCIRAIVGPIQESKFAGDLERLWGVDWDEAVRRHGLSPDVTGLELSTVSVLPGFRTADRRWPVRCLVAAFTHLIWDLDLGYAFMIQDVIGIRSLSLVLRIPIEPLGRLEPVDFLGPVQATISRAWDIRALLRTRDEEYRRLYVQRDGSGRGGTRLPPLDLTDSGPLALHRRLQAEYAARQRASV